MNTPPFDPAFGLPPGTKVERVSTQTLAFPPGLSTRAPAHELTATAVVDYSKVNSHTLTLEDLNAAQPQVLTGMPQHQLAGMPPRPSLIDELAKAPPPKSSPVAFAPVPVAINRPLTSSERNAQYIQIDLPSGFVFYPFKSLSAKLITGRVQAKLTHAANTNHLRSTIEAITACLGDGINAHDLTIPDFFYVMYWLRLNSYTAFEFTHISVCRNPAHHAKVAEGKLEPKTLKTMHTLKQTQITETKLAGVPQVPQIVQDAGLNIRPQRMSDVIDMHEWIDEKDPNHGEKQFLGLLAVHLDPVQTNPRWNPEGKPVLTFLERTELAAELPADLTRAILHEWENAVNSYGVVESIKVKCKECGAEELSELSVSASDFL